MTNRITEYSRVSRQIGQPPQPALQELRNEAQQEFTRRMRQIESLVQRHPVMGISAAFCIGILLGWKIKRS